MSDDNDAAFVGRLRGLADDPPLLWEVARRAIEDALVDFRDQRLNTDSHVIRMGPEEAVRIGLLALADHLDPEVHQ